MIIFFPFNFSKKKLNQTIRSHTWCTLLAPMLHIQCVKLSCNKIGCNLSHGYRYIIFVRCNLSVQISFFAHSVRFGHYLLCVSVGVASMWLNRTHDSTISIWICLTIFRAICFYISIYILQYIDIYVWHGNDAAFRVEFEWENEIFNFSERFFSHRVRAFLFLKELTCILRNREIHRTLQHQWTKLNWSWCFSKTYFIWCISEFTS